MGSRLCKYLTTQVSLDADVASKIQALCSFMSSMPKSCVRRLWTMKPMEPEDIMNVARSSMLDKSEAKLLMKNLMDKKSQNLTFEEKLALPQSLRDVMKTKEFGEVKELDAMKRHSFVRSVIKGKIEQRRKLAEMKSTLNQKALRSKMMESVMKPSLQNVLTVDLLRPIDKSFDADIMNNLTETPELMGCVSNKEMREINTDVLCAKPEYEGSDMYKELTEAQRRLVYERCQSGTKVDDLPGSLLSTMTSTEIMSDMDKMDAEKLEKMVKKLSKDEQLFNSEQVDAVAKKCNSLFGRDLSQANVTNLRVWVKRLSVIDVMNKTLKTLEDVNHYCQEMAKAKFEANDAVQVRDILEYCISKDDFARSLPDLYQEVSDMRTACRASHGCSGALMVALRDSDSKIFQKLATRHSLITAADESGRHDDKNEEETSCWRWTLLRHFECNEPVQSEYGTTRTQMLQFYETLNDTLAQSLGVILLALPDALKHKVNWASDDITSAAGMVDSGANKGLYETTYNAWKTQHKEISFDSTKLSVLKNILCGMPDSDIESVKNETYEIAARTIGILKCFVPAQLQAWAKKTGVFGETLLLSDLTTIGVVMAGKDSSYFTRLEPTKIPGITPLAVSMLDVDTFKESKTDLVVIRRRETMAADPDLVVIGRREAVSADLDLVVIGRREVVAADLSLVVIRRREVVAANLDLVVIRRREAVSADLDLVVIGRREVVAADLSLVVIRRREVVAANLDLVVIRRREAVAADLSLVVIRRREVVAADLGSGGDQTTGGSVGGPGSGGDKMTGGNGGGSGGDQTTGGSGSGSGSGGDQTTRGSAGGSGSGGDQTTGGSGGESGSGGDQTTGGSGGGSGSGGDQTTGGSDGESGSGGDQTTGGSDRGSGGDQTTGGIPSGSGSGGDQTTGSSGGGSRGDQTTGGSGSGSGSGGDQTTGGSASGSGSGGDQTTGGSDRGSGGDQTTGGSGGGSGSGGDQTTGGSDRGSDGDKTTGGIGGGSGGDQTTGGSGGGSGSGGDQTTGGSDRGSGGDQTTGGSASGSGSRGDQTTGGSYRGSGGDQTTGGSGGGSGSGGDQTTGGSDRGSGGDQTTGGSASGSGSRGDQTTGGSDRGSGSGGDQTTGGSDRGSGGDQTTGGSASGSGSGGDQTTGGSGGGSRGDKTTGGSGGGSGGDQTTGGSGGGSGSGSDQTTGGSASGSGSGGDQTTGGSGGGSRGDKTTGGSGGGSGGDQRRREAVPADPDLVVIRRREAVTEDLMVIRRREAVTADLGVIRRREPVAADRDLAVRTPKSQSNSRRILVLADKEVLKTLKAQSLTPAQKHIVKEAVTAAIKKQLAGNFSADYVARATDKRIRSSTNISAGDAVSKDLVKNMTDEQVKEVVENKDFTPTPKTVDYTNRTHDTTQRYSKVTGILKKETSSAAIVSTLQSLSKVIAAVRPAVMAEVVKKIQKVDKAVLAKLKDAEMTPEQGRLLATRYLKDNDMAGNTSAEVKTYYEDIPRSMRQNIPSDSLDDSMSADTAMKLMELFIAPKDDATSETDVLKATLESVSPLHLKLYTKATTQNLSLITNRDEISMLVKSKAMTVKDVAAVGEKLCEIDVDSFSGSQLSPDVGVAIFELCNGLHMLSASTLPQFGPLIAFASPSIIDKVVND
ncbi:hypothetical protein LSAT2_027511 [Lamellibrachia satsuma]|nr:hypothetical protein LSAT2_027511 [Lamellibrachia satsuma]